MRKASFLLSSVLALALPLLHAGVASAAPRSVEVVIHGSDEEQAALRAALAELLARLDLVVVGPDGEGGAIVRCDVDLERPDGATVTLRDLRVPNAPVVRAVPIQTDSRAMLLEEVAHVVQAGTESLLIGDQPKSPPPPPPPPTPVPTPSLVDRDAGANGGRPEWTLDLLTFANVQGMTTDGSAVFGVGAGARVDLGRHALRPGLWLFGAYHPPFGNVGLPVELRASVTSLRLLPTLELFANRSFLLEIGAGVGSDVFVLGHDAAVSAAVLSTDRTDASFIVTGLLAAHLSLGGGPRLFLAATVDWDTSPREYVLAQGSVRSALIQSMSVRPGLSLGFAFNVAGAAR